MNAIHRALLIHIREKPPRDPDSDIYKKIISLSDLEFMRLVFMNYRGEGNDAKGLRLSKTGLEVMNLFFTGFEIKKPDGEILSPMYLLYLDKKSSLPYFIGNENYVIFDSSFCVKLKLAGGKIGILLEIEGGLK